MLHQELPSSGETTALVLARMHSLLPTLQSSGLDPAAVSVLAEHVDRDQWHTTRSAEELKAQLHSLKVGFATQIAAEENASDAALKKIEESILDTDVRKSGFASWRTSTESYLRGRSDLLASEAEERICAVLDPSSTGPLLQKLSREYPVHRMGPARIRAAYPKLHAYTLQLCQEEAAPHIVELQAHLGALLATIPRSTISRELTSALVDALTVFVTQSVLEERPGDASQFRNLLLGSLFGSSIASLSQTLLAMQLAALPVISFMGFGLLLAKADWDCRERDRLSSHVEMQTSDTVARCRLQAVKYVREVKASFLSLMQSTLESAATEYERECESVLDQFKARFEQTIHRRTIRVASLGRRAALLDELICHCG